MKRIKYKSFIVVLIITIITIFLSGLFNSNVMATVDVTDSNGVKWKATLDDTNHTASIVRNSVMTGKVTIPSSITYNSTTYTVTELGSNALFNMSEVTEVELPNTIKKISSYAFLNCGITTITIPASVTDIYTSNAFDSCYSLTAINVNSGNSIYSSTNGILFNKDKTVLYKFPINHSLTTYTIPSTVTNVYEKAFYDCEKLTSIVMPDSVVNIGMASFTGCEALTNIKLSNNISRIPQSAFSRCTALRNITIPSNITMIGMAAFESCQNLESIVLPEGVTYIDGSAFSDCYSLRSVTLPETLTGLDCCVFRDCNSLTSIVIPNAVTSIGYDAFRGCTNLRNVQLPNNLENIAAGLFMECASLTSIKIPETVQNIYDEAFLECINLVDVDIPSSVTSIKTEAFSGCTSLRNLTIRNKECTISNDILTDSNNIQAITGYRNSTAETFANENSIRFVPLTEIFKVTFETNGGTIVEAEKITEYEEGIGATLPITVTKEGYTFEGWYDNSSLTGTKVTGILATETGDKTFYAKWIINEYTVTFKDGSKIEKTETVEYGAGATAPTLTKQGYTLSWDKEFNNVTSNLTVNAIWTANTNTAYKVEHYLRTADMEVESYSLHESENKTGTTGEQVTATAKTYTGFTENTTHSDRIISGAVAADGSLVLKLYYDRNTYNITYELNGGTATSTLTTTYLYGKQIVLSNKVEKEGYTFAGWYDNSSLTGTAVTSISEQETGNKTFYAKWVENDEFTISSTKYTINEEERYITHVSPNTILTSFLSNITTNGTAEVVNLNGNTISADDFVGTGYKLKVTLNGETKEYEIVVRGDIDGNGKITVTDLSMLNQHIVRRITLTGAREKAADIEYSGKITVTDLSMMNQALVGRIIL